MKNSRGIASIAGCALVAPACLGLIAGKDPAPLSPYPLLMILPAIALNFGYAAVIIPTCLFFVWNPRLLSGQSEIPKRTWFALGVLTFLTLVYFAIGWNDGVQFQGATFTRLVCLINVLWLLLLWFLLVQNWRKPSFILNLVLHWVLFAWLGWYAFPFLGELP